MSTLDIRQLVTRLKTIESIALTQRVASTNALGRRITDECIENEIPLPNAMIIAREQFAGEGRAERTWHSPAGKGIYSTTLVHLDASRIALLPLEVANVVRRYLHETFGIDARIKWPNDLLVGEKKIAGILMEARLHDGFAYTLIGVGINVFPDPDSPSHAATISDLSRHESVDLESATGAFVEAMDAALTSARDRDEILADWRQHSIHRVGDRITFAAAQETINGTWGGIDDFGRVLVRRGEETVTLAAGDVILMR